MSLADTSNTHVAVGVTFRYIRPVNGCVEHSEQQFGSSPYALDHAKERAIEVMATDSNVYEAVVTYSIIDRDREAEAFPQCYTDEDGAE